MGFIVKNTTFMGPMDLLCPHICKGCGALGEILCECCKKDITNEHVNFCPMCKQPTPDGKCNHCYLPPSFALGWRDEIIGKLVHDYKYNSVRVLAQTFAELLDTTLPFFADDVVIVPLPTIKKHVRTRGFDHTLKIAKALAKKRGWEVEQLLVRAQNTIQVGADKDWRLVQAADAYELVGTIKPDTLYLLFDDVWTTGASMKAALKKLQRAGASKVAMSVLAVSRIDH